MSCKLCSPEFTLDNFPEGDYRHKSNPLKEGNLMKILIAEDDPVSRRVLEKTLEKFGYEVIVTVNGEEAWDRYKSLDPTFLITDWMMPYMDGIELCRRIRDSEKAENQDALVKKYCYIIMLTAKSQIEDLVEGMTTGIDDFITKPFNNKELKVRVKAGERILDMEQKLMDANNKLKEADRQKSEFVGIVSHDLGTPMTVIKSFTQILLSSLLGDITEKQEEALERIKLSVDQMDDLRKDILDLTKIELSRMELEKENTNITELIDLSIMGMRGMAEAKEQEITFEAQNDLTAVCDKNKISRVVENYLSNAIRYTGEGGKIMIRGREDGALIHIEVKDNGRGIPTGEEENVFKRFYKVGQKIEGSTGLGLAIVRGIVEAHGGNAWCESDYGKGSNFHFSIPKT